jgi:hypothetical protein
MVLKYYYLCHSMVMITAHYMHTWHWAHNIHAKFMHVLVSHPHLTTFQLVIHSIHVANLHFSPFWMRQTLGQTTMQSQLMTVKH